MESYIYDGPPPPLMHDLMADGITGGGDDIDDLRKKVEMLLSAEHNDGNSADNTLSHDDDNDIMKFID